MYEILVNKYWAFDTQYFNRLAPLVMERIANGLPLTDLAVPNFKNRKHNAMQSNAEKEMKYESAYGLGKDNAFYNFNAPKENSIAVIEIFGTISKWGGLCSYGTKDYIEQIQTALNNPNYKGILLHVDTPGGSVDGTEELANFLYKAEKQKPIVTFADGLMASAGYWIGSQSSYIYASSATTSWVGSIGTLIMHIDQSAYLAKEGLKVTILTADRSTEKTIGNSTEPLTEEAIANFKMDLNSVNDTFINAVKRGRGSKLISEDKKDIFTGATFKGQDARTYGLVDNIGTIQNAVNKVRELAKIREIQNK